MTTTTSLSRETKEAGSVVLESSGLCGQEARAALWRQWARVGALMVHLIIVARCLSKD